MKHFVLNYGCVSSKLTFKALTVTQPILSVLLRQSSWLFLRCQHLRTLPRHLPFLRSSPRRAAQTAVGSAANGLSWNERPQRKLFKPDVCFTGLAQSLGCTLITPEPNLAQRERINVGCACLEGFRVVLDSVLCSFLSKYLLLPSRASALPICVLEPVVVLY